MMSRIYFIISLMLVLVITGCQSNQTVKIGLIKVGSFPDSEFDFVVSEIEAFYNASVTIIPNIELPQEAFYPPRSRYRADKLISILKHEKPDTLDLLLGLTQVDISTTKGEFDDWGIMGLAYRPGVSSIVSIFRIKRNSRNNNHTRERLSKVVLHEIGHNLGIPHCKDSETCLMKDTCGTVKTIDAEEKKLCKQCMARVGDLVRLKE